MVTPPEVDFTITSSYSKGEGDSDMNLHKLNYFIEIAKQRSYTKASKKLYVSQPALSKQMKLLEEEMGFPLFTRSAKGLELTEKGLSLYRDIEPLLNQLDHVVHQYQNHDTIRFGSTPLLSSYFLHKHYHKLEYTNFQVTAIEDDSQDLIPLLKANEIDAAIVQDIQSVKGLSSTLLFEDEFLAAIPSNSPIASQSSVTLEECFTQKQIIPPKGTSLHEKLQHIMAKNQFKSDVLETHYQAMAGIVSLGTGIAYLPEMMAKQIEYRGVTFLPIKGRPLKRDMYLYAITPSMLDFLFDKLSNESF
ncbi:LysR family transcriptional regulator [Pontibacillus yanchengensis]|uniref:LysR family transcriptional regulator n=2 Tax=Pontibacillus yanchengensis TaxID=462910 RepID=A0A6I5A096_9BACI|nr:LysR family transcriptional regulator [Pontibacillus yanchengensis]